MAISQVGRQCYTFKDYSYPEKDVTDAAGDEGKFTLPDGGGTQEKGEAGDAQDKPIGEMSWQEMRDFIRQYSKTIYEKVIKGETEPKFQIGGMEFTEKEWDRLIASLDKVIEQIKEQQEDEEERRRKESGRDKGTGEGEEDSLLDIAGDIADKIAGDRRSVRPDIAKSKKKMDVERLEAALRSMTRKTEEQEKLGTIADLLIDMIEGEGREDIAGGYDRNNAWRIMNSTDSGISNKAAQTGKDAAEAYEELFQFSAQGVREAWSAAKEECGTDGFSRDEEGKLTHITQLMIERLAGSHDSYGTILGDTAGSAYAFAARAAENLRHELKNTMMEEQVRRHTGRELEFYEAFMKNLRHIMAE